MSLKVSISSLLHELHVSEEEQMMSLFGHKIVYVWVQGRVIESKPETREFMLNDGTGVLAVNVVNDHVSLEDVEVGRYVMVPRGIVSCGEIEETNESIIYLEAKLVMVLPDDQADGLDKLWTVEVQECRDAMLKTR
jgi:hypothetical protein